MTCRQEDEHSRSGTGRISARLLVVGEQPFTTELVDSEYADFSVVCVQDRAEAISVLEDRTVDCVVSTDRLADEDVLDLLAAVRDRFRVPFVLVAFDGSERLASDAVSAGVAEYIPVDPADDYGEVIGAITEILDDTHRSPRQTELEGFEAAIEHAADAIIVTDPDGIIEYVNPAFEELTGYNRRQAVGRTPRILKSGEQDRSYYERMWTAILEGEIWEETIVNETRTGQRYVAHQTVAPVTDEGGEIKHFVGIQRDVTRQNRLEEQLERSKETLSRLYEVTTQGLDIEEKIERVLTLGSRHLDFPIGYFTRIADGKQEVLAAVGDHEQIQAGAVDPLEQTYCRRTVGAEDPVTLSDAETEGWEDDPAYRHFELRCYLGTQVTVDGEVYGTLCFAGEEPREQLILDAQQSTVRALANWIGYELERERRERKLEQQNERLERFASAVSHDLRNPLNVAQAYVELSRENDEHHLDEVTGAHERMETIIDDTLTLAREGELVESTEELSIEELARRCWESVETGDATLEVERDVSVHGDADKLRHVFENLFCNSVEHAGDEPTIRVGPGENGFYVEDDGPGIDEDDRERVFEYGFSNDCGSGFGLSIVETIVHAHGWTVEIADSAEGGARFEFDTDGRRENRVVY